MENKNYIYLDSAATASNLMFDIADDFANPNSVHDAGRDSFAALEDARESVAKNIGAKRPSEVVFTSGATEANNMAIFGMARALANKRNLRNFDNLSHNKPRVIISAIEHESVLMPAKELLNEGFELKIADVDATGAVKWDELERLINNHTVLVSVQHSNTEIGVIQKIKPMVDLVHEHDALFHSDCVGSFGRIPLDVFQLGFDAASFSGHKIGTAKGIGVLYLRSKTPFKPLIFGSGQENGMRGGTQNVALALQLQKALNFCNKHINEDKQHFLELKHQLADGISDMDNLRPTVDLYDTENYLPNIVHLLYKNISSETLILHYGKHKIQVSGGPACSSNDKEPSHVLKALKIPNNEIDGALRISFSRTNTKNDICKFLEATKALL